MYNKKYLWTSALITVAMLATGMGVHTSSAYALDAASSVATVSSDNTDVDYRTVNTMITYGVNIPQFPGMENLKSYDWAGSHNPPAGQWYNAYDYAYLDWTPQSNWYDTNKWHMNTAGPDGRIDGRLCWAATTSNQMYWWITENRPYVEKYFKVYPQAQKELLPGHTILDPYDPQQYAAIFDYLGTFFTNFSGYPTGGEKWFITGEKDSTFVTPFQPGMEKKAQEFKGFFSHVFNANNNNVDGLVGYRKFPTTNLDIRLVFSNFIRDNLSQRRSVSFNVNFGGLANHAVNLWGAEFNKDGIVDFIYYTDSNESTNVQASRLRRMKILYSRDHRNVYMHGDPHATIDNKYKIIINGINYLDLGQDSWKKWDKENSNIPLAQSENHTDLAVLAQTKKEIKEELQKLTYLTEEQLAHYINQADGIISTQEKALILTAAMSQNEQNKSILNLPERTETHDNNNADNQEALRQAQRDLDARITRELTDLTAEHRAQINRSIDAMTDPNQADAIWNRARYLNEQDRMHKQQVLQTEKDNARAKLHDLQHLSSDEITYYENLINSAFDVPSVRDALGKAMDADHAHQSEEQRKNDAQKKLENAKKSARDTLASLHDLTSAHSEEFKERINAMTSADQLNDLLASMRRMNESDKQEAQRQADEKARQEREKVERERQEREKAEREKAEREKAEKARQEREKAEKARREREKAEKERQEEAQRNQIQRLLPAGRYYIQATTGKTVLDVSGLSRADGGNVGLWSLNYQTNQQWDLTYDNNGYASLRSVHSGKYLDLNGAYARTGQNIQQWTANASKAQKWTIRVQPDGSLMLISAVNPQFVIRYANPSASVGTNIDLSYDPQYRGSGFVFIPTQWAIRTPSEFIADGYYKIASHNDHNLVVDLFNWNQTLGARFGMWNSTSGDNQVFRITRQPNGYYRIMNTWSGQMMDSAFASPLSSMNLLQWKQVPQANQDWSFVRQTDGSLALVNVGTGLTVDMVQRSMRAGAYLEGSRRLDGPSQHFDLLKVSSPQETLRSLAQQHRNDLADGIYTFSADRQSQLLLDMTGRSHANGANAGMWVDNSGANQRWRITHNSAGFVVIQNVESGLYLDVNGALRAAGANVQQWQRNNSIAQQWVAQRVQTTHGVRYQFVSAVSPSLVLNYDTARSGANVFLGIKGNTSEQMWNMRRL